MRKRLFFKHRLNERSSGEMNGNQEKVSIFDSVTEDRANLISSHAADRTGLHYPTLDIDLPCELRESSPGKFHLYIDAPMQWSQYRLLLDVLATVGIVERGYADASIAKGASFLRKPGTYKNPVLKAYDPAKVVVMTREVYDALGATTQVEAPQVKASEFAWGPYVDSKPERFLW